MTTKKLKDKLRYSLVKIGVNKKSISSIINHFRGISVDSDIEFALFVNPKKRAEIDDIARELLISLDDNNNKSRRKTKRGLLTSREQFRLKETIKKYIQRCIKRNPTLFAGASAGGLASLVVHFFGQNQKSVGVRKEIIEMFGILSDNYSMRNVKDDLDLLSLIISPPSSAGSVSWTWKPGPQFTKRLNKINDLADQEDEKKEKIDNDIENHYQLGNDSVDQEKREEDKSIEEIEEEIDKLMILLNKKKEEEAKKRDKEKNKERELIKEMQSINLGIMRSLHSDIPSSLFDFIYNNNDLDLLSLERVFNNRLNQTRNNYADLESLIKNNTKIDKKSLFFVT